MKSTVGVMPRLTQKVDGAQAVSTTECMVAACGIIAGTTSKVHPMGSGRSGFNGHGNALKASMHQQPDPLAHAEVKAVTTRAKVTQIHNRGSHCHYQCKVSEMHYHHMPCVLHACC